MLLLSFAHGQDLVTPAVHVAEMAILFPSMLVDWVAMQ